MVTAYGIRTPPPLPADVDGSAIIRSQATLRRRLFDRDNGVCVVCDVFDDKWAADHILPLWLVDRKAPDAWKYWTIDNAQTLCESCHQSKTTQEHRARAKIDRLTGKTKNTRRGRAIPSRPFQRVHRPLRRKRDEEPTR